MLVKRLSAIPCAHFEIVFALIGAMMKIYDGSIKTIANSCYGTDKTREIEDARI